jgi:hypothetical protein
LAGFLRFAQKHLDDCVMPHLLLVIPAAAGQARSALLLGIPAKAGMTGKSAAMAFRPTTQAKEKASQIPQESTNPPNTR